jgi:hypothetical protein
MKPILFTMPRTGSTIVTRLLGNIAEQHYNYANNLVEYFLVATNYKAEFSKDINGIVRTISYIRNNPSYQWYSDKRQIILDRLNLLEDKLYMIKIFPMDLEPEVIEYMKTYDIIYLERRNKIHQLLSFINMEQTNIAEYKKGDKEVNKIIYLPPNVDIFFNVHYNPYYNFKKNNPSKYPTLYYEDFMELGGDEQALIKLLNLDIVDYILPGIFEYIPTPYTKENLEDLIINKKDWNNDKQRILDVLYKT